MIVEQNKFYHGGIIGLADRIHHYELALLALVALGE